MTAIQEMRLKLSEHIDKAREKAADTLQQNVAFHLLYIEYLQKILSDVVSSSSTTLYTAAIESVDSDARAYADTRTKNKQYIEYSEYELSDLIDQLQPVNTDKQLESKYQEIFETLKKKVSTWNLTGDTLLGEAGVLNRYLGLYASQGGQVEEITKGSWQYGVLLPLPEGTLPDNVDLSKLKTQSEIGFVKLLGTLGISTEDFEPYQMGSSVPTEIKGLWLKIRQKEGKREVVLLVDAWLLEKMLEKVTITTSNQDSLTNSPESPRFWPPKPPVSEDWKAWKHHEKKRDAIKKAKESYEARVASGEIVLEPANSNS
jgi:hypothetical protein